MLEFQRYYELADQAAGRGEVAFLRHCVDEILRGARAGGFGPDYPRLFKALYEARLYFLHQHTDRGPKALLESIPTDVLDRLRDLDDLVDLVTSASEGRPVSESIRRLCHASVHPIRPIKP